MKKLIVSISILLALPFPSLAINKDFDDFVYSHMKEFNIPGVSVQIVDNEKVLYTKGYGLRDLEKALPMTPDTISAIASISKSFGTATFAKLVDMKKANWETPVYKYLPGFRLKDSYASHWTTPIDLMAHRTGSARHDYILWTGKFTQTEAFEKLPLLDMSTSFRKGFGYTNTMYMVLSRLVEKLSSESWPAFTKRELLDPLGMDRTLFSTEEFKADGNHAKPHHSDKGVPAKFHYYTNADETGAAGQIYSSAADLGKWLQLHIRNGANHIGSPVLDPRSVMKMHTMHTNYNFYGTPEQPFQGYGLGWFVGSYRGEKVISHGGSRYGAVSKIGFLPGKKLGIVVLFNSWAGAPSAVFNRAMDLLLKLEPIDWMERWSEGHSEEEPEETVYLPAPLPVEKYVGQFSNPIYGEVEVKNVGGQLLLSFGGQPNFFIHGPILLKHIKNNVFEAQNANNKIIFNFGSDGEISEIHWQLTWMSKKKTIFGKVTNPKSAEAQSWGPIIKRPKIYQQDWQ